MWDLSDYLRFWGIDKEKNEITESAVISGYRIFIKEDVLIVFFAEGNDESVNAVQVASFNESGVMEMLPDKAKNSEISDFATNLIRQDKKVD